MKKRVLSLLAVLGLLVLPASAGGAAERYSPLADGPIVIEDTGLRPIIAEYDESITPYLTHLSQASCNLTIEDGAVNFYGMVTMYRNRYSRIILTLQRSANGVTWTDVPDMEWLQIWYTNGAHMLSKSLTNLPGGYYYRAHNEAAALDTNYAVLETVHVYSNPQYKAI